MIWKNVVCNSDPDGAAHDLEKHCLQMQLFSLFSLLV